MLCLFVGLTRECMGGGKLEDTCSPFLQLIVKFVLGAMQGSTPSFHGGFLKALLLLL